MSSLRRSERSLAVAASFVAILADLALLAPPAAGRLRDASLLVRLDSPPFAGATLACVAPGGEVRSEPLGSASGGSLLFRDLTSGEISVELRDDGGRVLRSWTLFLAPELTTVAHLHAGEGRLTVSPDHPDPFGNALVWSEPELGVVPGQGAEGPLSLSLANSDVGLRWNGGSRGPVSRLRGPEYSLRGDAAGITVPLGATPSFRASASSFRSIAPAEVTTDRFGANGGRALAGGGTGGEVLGTAGLRLARRTPLGELEIAGAFQGRRAEDAGPLGFATDSNQENGIDALETRWTAFLRPARLGLGRFDFHAAGQSRRHYLQEYRRNPEHNPREDRSALRGSGEWEVAVGPAEISIGAAFTRAYHETGDGQAFDRISNYRIGSLQNDAVTTEEYGLYWWGGPGGSIRKPHLYNYYTQDLATAWTYGAEGRVLPHPDFPLRAGIEVLRASWRWYEHLAPIADASIPDPAQTGYQYASYLGYSRDASRREDLPGHEAPEPRVTALFLDQSASFGPARLEGGLRWSAFRAGQRPLRELNDPLGADSALTEHDLGALPRRAFVDPAAGLHAALGSKVHLWADAARSHALPPLEALYFSPNVLTQQASLAEDGPLTAARDLVFGNPALRPEETTTFSLALGRELDNQWNLRATGRLARTEDTWVARQHAIDGGPHADSLAFYENRGHRRERSLRLDVQGRPWAHTRIRGAYVWSARETDVIEPAPLYRAVLLPDAPAEGTGVRETSPLAPLWLDDGGERDWFPSLFDRTHQFAVVWTSRLGQITAGTPAEGVLADLDLTAVVRAGSGLPYTPTYRRQEGLLAGSSEEPAPGLTPGEPVDPNGDGLLDGSEIQSRRMDWSWQADLGVRRPFHLAGQRFTIALEVRNLANRKNPRQVYGATGEADDDGWIDSLEGQDYLWSLGDGAGRFREAYAERLDNPLRYENGRVARAMLSWAF